MSKLFLLNLPLAITISLVTFRFFSYLNTVDLVLCFSLLYFSWIIAAEQLLGIFGLLTFENLLLLNIISLCLALLLARKTLREMVMAKDILAKMTRIISENNFNILFISLLGGFVAVKLFYNLYNPPFGWDSLNYHFTFAVEWLKNKNLETPIVVFDNPCPSYYPINGSLIYLWWIIPFCNVYLADLGQAPFFILVFLAIYNICRKLNVSSGFSFFAALLMSLVPNYFKQLSIAYVDVMICAWFLISINFLVNLQKKINPRDAILFSLGFGMLIGTKTVALAYSFILLPFFVWLLIRKDLRPYGIVILLTFLILSVFVGGFGYLRTYIETGNPLYPSGLKAFGRVIFRGVMDKSNFTAFVSSEDYSLGEILFHEGMGGQTVLFVLPAVFLLILFMFKRRKIVFCEALLLSSFVYLYLIYRYAFSLPNVRYLYPALGVGFIISFYALGSLKFPVKILRWLVFVCVISSLPEIARKQELVISFLSSGLILSFIFYIKDLLPQYASRITIAIVLIFFLILGMGNANYNKYEFSRYIKTTKFSGFWPDATRAWEWLNTYTSGNNIAYSGRPVPFPLYGTKFKNNVFYVSVNKVDPAKLHYFPWGYYQWGSDFLEMHNSFLKKNNYRAGADFSVWLANLRKRKADYLFVYSLHQTKEIIFPLEDQWASANPDIFISVFKNNTVHIYRILK